MNVAAFCHRVLMLMTFSYIFIFGVNSCLVSTTVSV